MVTLQLTPKKLRTCQDFPSGLGKSGKQVCYLRSVPFTILILTNRMPYPLRDGGARAMDAMIRGYHDAGLNVHLLAMNTSRHPVSAEILNRLYPDIAGFYTVAVDNAVTTTGIIKNLLLSRDPEHVQRFRSPAFTGALIKLLHNVRPDVVQLESPFLGCYIPDIRKHAPEARIVYRMHNVEGQIWARLAKESTGMKRSYLHLLAARIARYERQLWADVDLLLPITATDAASVQKAGITTPLEVAPFGVAISEQEQALPTGFFKLYHIGAMDWLPNQESIRWFLDEVWPRLHVIAPGLTFHFAGRNMPAAFHKALPEGAFCEGEVSDAEAFVRDKHILVVPLRSGGGIRVKILEAMAQGKLVISTDVGIQGMEAQPDVHYLAANRAQDFIRQAVWAGEHPGQVARLVGAARQLVHDHYDGKIIMSRIISRLETIIASGA